MYTSNDPIRRSRLLSTITITLSALATLALANPLPTGAATYDLTWFYAYDGYGFFEELADMAVDADGNVIVTGESAAGAVFDEDMVTIKLAPDGTVLWTAVYDGPLGGADRGLGLALGPDGSVYVTGQTDHSLSVTPDIITIRYSSDGEELWRYRYNHPYDSLDRGTDIVVDAAGNAFVSGYSKVSFSEYHFTTISIDASGNERWVNHVESPDGLGWAITLDSEGNPIVAGTDDFTLSTIQYDRATGKVEWRRIFTLGFGGEALDVANDDEGNTYVTGYASTGVSGVLLDWVTVKYGTNGELLWFHQYDGPDRTLDQAQALALDRVNGRVLVTGYSEGIGSASDITTISLDAETGDLLWQERIDGPESGLDIGEDVEVDLAGNVYVIGTWVEGAGGARQQILIGYDRDGNERFRATLGSVSFTARQVRVSTYGRTVFTGGVGAGDYSVARYDADATTDVATPRGVSPLVKLLPPVPNPFRIETTIRYELAEPAFVQLRLYDTSGRLIRILDSGERSAGSHSASLSAADGSQPPLAPGVYYARLEAATQQRVRAVVLSP